MEVRGGKMDFWEILGMTVGGSGVIGIYDRLSAFEYMMIGI